MNSNGSLPNVGDVIRIFSDLHFGDRSSRVHRLAQIRPLLEGTTQLVFNGDSLDTRPGPSPERTVMLRAELEGFFRQEIGAATFITGNHDADISSQHALDLAGGKIFAVHGDILFETIVPWSRDVPLIASLIAEEFAALSPAARLDLTVRLGVWRRVAGRIPQREQNEPRLLKRLLHLVADTAWPPWRVLRILQAWHEEPGRAATLLRQHRPAAKFILIGHTHRPGLWRMPNGIVVINTGSFCPPLGGWVVDISEAELRVRRVIQRQNEFRLGQDVAAFPL